MAFCKPRARFLRHILAASVLGLGFSTPMMAQSDPLARARLQRTLAEQKATANVTDAIQQADLLAKTAPAKAIERLKQTVLGLDLSVELSTGKRKELTDLVQTQIAAIEARMNETATTQDPKAATTRAEARKAMEAAAQEAKDVAEALAKADQHLARGEDGLARAIIRAANIKYPNNPSLLVSQKQDEFASQIKAEKELSQQYAAAWVENMRSVTRSAIPATGDIEFPDRAKWEDLTKRRRQPAIKLTPKEEQILESLNKTVGATFKDRPFEEALQELSNMIEHPIFIDKRSLEDLGLDLSRNITFQGSVSARTALRAILQSNGLTFVVKDEMIQVMTIDKAQQTLVTRSYYLGDLVSGNGAFGNALQWGPVASYQQAMQNAQQIIDAITNSVDPMAWNTSKSNGPCTIAFNLPTMSVIVRASAEVHASLGNTLTGAK